MELPEKSFQTVSAVNRHIENLKKCGNFTCRPVVSYPRKIQSSRYNPYQTGVKRYEANGYGVYRKTILPDGLTAQLALCSRRGRPRKNLAVSDGCVMQGKISQNQYTPYTDSSKLSFSQHQVAKSQKTDKDSSPFANVQVKTVCSSECSDQSFVTEDTSPSVILNFACQIVPKDEIGLKHKVDWNRSGSR